jgi:hypothetical protein
MREAQGNRERVVTLCAHRIVLQSRVPATQLLGPALVQMWGSGCEAAPVTRFAIEPTGDGWWIEIEIGGVQLWDRSAPSNTAHGVVALDSAEATRVLDVLLGDRAGVSACNFDMTGVGLIRMTLPLATGDLERVVDGPCVMPIAETLLELARRAGISTNERMHPTGGR